MTEQKLVFKTKDADKGFRGIKEVEGDLVGMDLKPAKPNPELGFEPSDQMECTLTNAIIREMDEGTPMPTLKDGKFVFWVKYAASGKVPSEKSGYVIGFLGTAEKLGIDLPPAATNHPRVIVRHEEKFPLGFTPKGKTEEATANAWVFVAGTASKAEDVADYVTTLIVGQNKAMATRAVILDAKAKRYPEYKAALDTGTITTLCPKLVLDEQGVYRIKS